jgi:hypothetical protein
MKLQITTKTHTQKDGTTWEWQETPELREFIRQQNTTKDGNNERAS